MKKNFLQKGFSLVEVLVAVTILLLVVTGPMTIRTRTTQSTTCATEQATALCLAQEGLELVQMWRDREVLQAFRAEYPGGGTDVNAMTDFDTYLANCLGSNVCGLYIGSAASPGISQVSCNGVNITNCKLYTHTSASTIRPVYTHVSTGSSTPYTRTVNITRIPATGQVREYRVSSVVMWRSGSLVSDQRVELVTYIENVYDNN